MSRSDRAIAIRGVSKAYDIGASRGRFSTLGEMMAHRLRRPLERAATSRFWALKDVTLDIYDGEAVGIIGRNGAGKSTLLKILSRITEPTSGEIDLYGRVGSLLEVGTGFHGELTGRENIYLSGAILGMTRREIDRQFDEIVAFSEVEKFLDTPVKRYSSGMYVRLAFGVAAHLNPEILVVDEVLAVGDAAFQRKCMGKMGAVAKTGRTVLFVSHNMTALQNVCTRAVWLHQGQVREDGPAGQVVQSYMRSSFESETERTWTEENAPGADAIRVKRVCVRPESGRSWDPITVSTPYVMEFDFWNREPGAHLNASIHVLNAEGLTVFNSGPLFEREWHRKPWPAGLFRTACHVPGDLMNNGSYRVLLLFVKNESYVIYKMDDAVTFEVHDCHEMRGGYHGDWPGAVRPNLRWTTELLEPAEEERGAAAA